MSMVHKSNLPLTVWFTRPLRGALGCAAGFVVDRNVQARMIKHTKSTPPGRSSASTGRIASILRHGARVPI